MTHRELIAKAATWLIALLIGILGGSVFTTVRAGACDRSVSVPSWFQRLQDWTNTSPPVRLTTRAMTPIHPEAPGTSVASRNPRPVTSKSHSATAETREPGRIDPFMPLVGESGTPRKILAPSLPTSRGLQAASASLVPGETLQLPPAGVVQPSHGFPRRTGPARASERSSRDENMSVLLDMLGRAISGGMDVLNKDYRGAHAASVSYNTFLSAGQAPSADRSTRSPGVPIPLHLMTDKNDASLYQLSTGPIFDRRRAEDIVNQLLAAGLSANVSIQGQATLERFRVVSEILLPSVAQHRVAGLADLHPEQELLDDGRLKLQFGTFSTEQEATALAETIRRRGYAATAEATGGARFVVTVNPSPQAGVDRSIAIIRANGADLTVRVRAAP